MRVLVACEESQRVCLAFREKGHEAYSCDIVETSGDHPEWHIKDDVRNHLSGWDLIIAHPPCTYLSAAGACRMYPRAGELDPIRYEKAMEAKHLFMLIYNSNAPMIAIENPKPLRCVGLPKETQRIQPYWFGDPYSKLTYLWLKGLPPLETTNILQHHTPWVCCGTSRNKGNKEKAGFSTAGGAQKVRSRTFLGIAAAMAEQWG